MLSIKRILKIKEGAVRMESSSNTARDFEKSPKKLKLEEDYKFKDGVVEENEKKKTIEIDDCHFEKDDVWVVRKVIVENSDDDDDDSTKNNGTSSRIENVVESESEDSRTVNLSIEEQFDKMCLHEAVDKRLFVAVYRRLRLSDTQVDHLNVDGATALHYAAENGSAAIALLLIDEGADVNKPDGDGFTPLILASNNNHVETMKILLDSGASINYSDDNQLTALHYSVSRGNKKAVKTLLKAGARTDIGDYEGYLPYHYALFDKYFQLAKLILKYAPINDVDRQEDEAYRE